MASPSWYMGVCGDGENVYIGSYSESQPFFTSQEKDGLTWAPHAEGSQKFSEGPFEMAYDAKNRIMYSASWGAGLLALKIR